MIQEQTKDLHHRLILNALNNNDLISLEIAEATNLSQHQVSRRMSELRREDKIIEVGLKEVLRNGKNKNFTVYSLK